MRLSVIVLIVSVVSAVLLAGCTPMHVVTVTGTVRSLTVTNDNVRVGLSNMEFLGSPNHIPWEDIVLDKNSASLNLKLGEAVKFQCQEQNFAQFSCNLVP